MSATIPALDLKADTALETVIPNAGHLSASQMVRRLFRMAILFLAARLLGVENFGTYALLLTVVEMVAVISGYGYTDFLTREIAQRPHMGWSLGFKVTLLRLTYIPLSLCIALLALKAIRFPSSVIVNTALLGIALVPRAVGESAQGLMKGLRRFAALPWIESVQGSIVLGVAPALILGGWGIRGVITAEILGALAGAVVSVWSVAGRLTLNSSDTSSLSALAHSMAAFNVYPFITNIYDRVDIVLLSKLAGNLATGIYSLPYRVYATLHIIPYGVMGALLPVFSSSEGGSDVRETCAAAMNFLYLTALLIVLGTLTFAGPVVLLLLGRNYTGSIITVKILVWACVPAFLNFALNIVFLAARKERVFLWTASVCTIVNIIANLLLIPRFSFIAAAVVTVLTECLLLVQNLYLIKRLMGRLVLPNDGAKITVVFGLVLAGFLVLQRALPQLWAGSVACAVFAAFAVWMAAGLRHFRATAGHQYIK